MRKTRMLLNQHVSIKIAHKHEQPESIMHYRVTSHDVMTACICTCKFPRREDVGIYVVFQVKKKFAKNQCTHEYCTQGGCGI